MKYYSTLNPMLVTFAVNTKAFTPSMPKKQAVAKKVDIDFFNPTNDIDLEHAHDCAEHFGKCSVEELESMKSALHTERIQHQVLDFQLDLEKDLDHLILEEDLSFQLALLKDEMHTLPHSSSPHFIKDGKPAFLPPPVILDSAGNAAISKQPKLQRSNMNSTVQRGEEMFLIPNGLSDTIAIGAALLIIALSPHLFSN